MQFLTLFSFFCLDIGALKDQMYLLTDSDSSDNDLHALLAKQRQKVKNVDEQALELQREAEE